MMASCFDGDPPDLADVVVAVGDRTVLALCFDTTTAPYVVKNPLYGTSEDRSMLPADSGWLTIASAIGAPGPNQFCASLGLPRDRRQAACATWSPVALCDVTRPRASGCHTVTGRRYGRSADSPGATSITSSTSVEAFASAALQSRTAVTIASALGSIN